MSSSRPRTLVVFDFDWSLVDDNTDVFIIKQLRPELIQTMEDLRRQAVQWTQIVDTMLQLLHQDGVTREELVRALVQIPMQEGMTEAIRHAHSQGCGLHIISDANTVFISEILRERELSSLFENIVTNPASFDERGRLSVRTYQSSLPSGPHDCKLCPVQMCKGDILRSLRQGFDRVLYVGDGTGDYCAATRMTDGDVLLARADSVAMKFGLLRKIRSNPESVSAKVIEWSTGLDVLRAIKEHV